MDWKYYDNSTVHYYIDDGLKIINELNLVPSIDSFGKKYLMFLCGEKFLNDHKEINDLIQYDTKVLQAYEIFKTRILPAIESQIDPKIPDALKKYLKEDIIKEIKESVASIKRVIFPWRDDYECPRVCVHRLAENNVELEYLPASGIDIHYSEYSTTTESSIKGLPFYVCKNCHNSSDKSGCHMFLLNGMLNLHLPIFGTIFIQLNKITDARFLDYVDKPFKDVPAVDLSKHINWYQD